MMTTNELIDHFLSRHNNDHRAAIAWLIGRMDAAERFEKRIKEACCVLCTTTIEIIEKQKKDRK